MAEKNAEPLPRRIHLIGIGGIGLSAIACVLATRGHMVTGSDLRASPVTEALDRLGVVTHVGHAPEHLGQADLVVASSAIPEGNAEVLEARRRGIPVLLRREFLPRLLAGHEVVAVAGTHGKTTTTAMIAYILQRVGMEPSYIIGGLAPQLGGNARAGAGRCFVIEADEYDRMFHGLWPKVAIVTNLEMDHPDCYPDMEGLREAFAVFMEHTSADGVILACADSPELMRTVRESAAIKARVLTYGVDTQADWRVRHVRPNTLGGCDFAIEGCGSGWDVVSTAIPGQHNALNAAAALLASKACDVDPKLAAAAVQEFHGVSRRFQIKGHRRGVLVIDDYAHHPTEVRATLAAARMRYPNRRLWVVFQPHTYSRTVALLGEFALCFADADRVLVMDIFAARAKEQATIHARDLVRAVQANRAGPETADYIGGIAEAAEYLLSHLGGDDVLLTLGAGDGYLVGERVLTALKEQETT